MNKIIYGKKKSFFFKKNDFFYFSFTCGFFCHDWQINVSLGTIFANLAKIWKNLWQLINEKVNPIKYSSLHTNSICDLDAHIKSVGSVKIHVKHEAIISPATIHVYLSRTNVFQVLCFEGCFSHGWAWLDWLWEKHLLMKGNLSLNTTVHDLMNLLHCENSLQKHKSVFLYLSCMWLVLQSFDDSHYGLGRNMHI